MHELVNALAGQTVLIVGDIMLDEYIWGDMTRISPEAPVPIVQTRRRTYRPGGAANVAANIAALDGVPFLAGIVGADAIVKPLQDALTQAQVPVSTGMQTAVHRATTVKTRIVAHNQQVLRLDNETATALETDTEDQLIAWCTMQMPNARVCVLSDYAKGVVSPRVAQAVIAAAKLHNLPIVVDPKGRDFAKYQGATVVTPNLTEAALATGHLAQEEGPDKIAQHLLGVLAGSKLLITRGAEGMTLYAHDAPGVHFAAHARTVYDVSGAGDTVVALLALGLAAGAEIQDAIRLANLGAGIVVGRFGTATVNREDLIKEIAQL